MHAKIQAVYLPALAQFAAKQDVRYYLNGFLIEPAPKHIGGVYLVASDGHTCCVIHDPDGSSDGTYIMPVTPALVSHCKPHSDDVLGIKYLTFDGQMATLSDNTGPLLAEKCQPIDGQYPDWRKAMLPQMPLINDTVIRCIDLNPAYLSRIHAALKAMGIKKAASCPITIVPRDGNSPLFFPRTTGGHRMYFVIMAMRGAEDNIERLNWLTDLIPDQKEQPTTTQPEQTA